MLAVLSIGLQLLRVKLFDRRRFLRARAVDGRLRSGPFRSGNFLLNITANRLLNLIVAAIVDIFQGSVVLICLRLIYA